MPDRSEARAMADQMIAIIDRLAAGEVTKRTLTPGTPACLDKAIEVERDARLAFRWSQVQLQFAERASLRGVAPDAMPLDMVEPRPLDVILAGWWEAQLRLEIAPPASADAIRAADDIERLREEYQAVSAAKV